MKEAVSLLVLLGLLASMGCGQSKSVATDIPQDTVKADVASEEPTESPALAAPSGPQPSAAAEASAPHAATPPPPPSEQAKGQRPRADRTRGRPGEAEKITFDDLNLGMQADVVFREFMVSDRVKDLEGKRVSIVGFIHGAPESRVGIKKFILLKNTQCKFGPGGQADHLTDVVLRQGVSTNYTTGDITVEGTLRIEPFQGNDGNTWSIYRLEDAQIR